MYRPSVVVGHSKTGEMDKIDGPYYFFKAIQKARHALPEWFPLVGLEFGYTNIVPVDYVAAAMDHIAHQPGLDGQAFHLIGLQVPALGRGPQHLRQGRARAAHGHPHRQAADRRAAQGRRLAAACSFRRSRACGARSSPTSGSPRRSSAIVGFTAQFDTRDTERALAGTGIEVPPLDDLRRALWDYWERVLDPDLYKDRSFEARHQRAHGGHHRRVERHRPRGGA